MPDEIRNMLRYRILRYTPNLVRDEWVNIGVLLEEGPEEQGGNPGRLSRRLAIQVIEEESEMARVRRLHPGADEALLRALPAEFDATFARGRVRSGSLRGETRQHAFKRAAIQPSARLAGGKF